MSPMGSSSEKSCGHLFISEYRCLFIKFKIRSHHDAESLGENGGERVNLNVPGIGVGLCIYKNT